MVRSGVDGKLHVTDDGLIPYPTDPGVNPVQVPGFWLGLAMLHTLFTREHNAICDHLKSRYPAFSDDDLFEHARLINAALVAKIHSGRRRSSATRPRCSPCARTGEGWPASASTTSSAASARAR